MLNNTNCYEPIVEVLESNFNDYQMKFKTNVISLIDDKRIHLCLYFLEPLDSLRQVDLEIMKKISV